MSFYNLGLSNSFISLSCLLNVSGPEEVTGKEVLSSLDLCGSKHKVDKGITRGGQNELAMRPALEAIIENVLKQKASLINWSWAF